MSGLKKYKNIHYRIKNKKTKEGIRIAKLLSDDRRIELTMKNIDKSTKDDLKEVMKNLVYQKKKRRWVCPLTIDNVCILYDMKFKRCKRIEKFESDYIKSNQKQTDKIAKSILGEEPWIPVTVFMGGKLKVNY